MQQITSDRAPTTFDASLERWVDRSAPASAVTRDGTLSFTSPRFDDLFGLVSGAGRGIPLAAICARPDRERVIQAVQAATQAPSPDPDVTNGAPIAFDALRCDGSVFAAELFVSTGAFDDGATAVLLVTDVSKWVVDERPGSPPQAARVGEHRGVLEDLSSLSRGEVKQGARVAVRFLHEWFVRHVDQIDKPMGAWLSSRGAR